MRFVNIVANVIVMACITLNQFGCDGCGPNKKAKSASSSLKGANSSQQVNGVTQSNVASGASTNGASQGRKNGNGLSTAISPGPMATSATGTAASYAGQGQQGENQPAPKQTPPPLRPKPPRTQPQYSPSTPTASSGPNAAPPPPLHSANRGHLPVAPPGSTITSIINSSSNSITIAGSISIRSCFSVWHRLCLNHYSTRFYWCCSSPAPITTTTTRATSTIAPCKWSSSKYSRGQSRRSRRFSSEYSGICGSTAATT